MLISFEGVDGAGKSSVLADVARILKKENFPILTTRMPGGTELGKEIRKILLNPDSDHDQRADFFLFMADFMLADSGLSDDKIVLTDRHKDSTMVYQLCCSGVFSEAETELLQSVLVNIGKMPDLTFIFDVSYENAKKRLDTSEFSRKDRFESVDKRLWEERRRTYLSLQKIFPERKFVLVDTNKMKYGQIVRFVSAYIQLFVLASDKI